MDTRWAKLCIFLILCSEFCCGTVTAASVTASITPTPAIKGSNRQHNIKCSFSLGAEEGFQGLKVLRVVAQADDIELARMNLNGDYFWFGTGDGLSDRGSLLGSQNEGYLSIVLNNTLCADNGKMYKCVLDYERSGNVLEATEDTTTVQVEAPPLAPNPMVIDPTSENVTEFTEVMFSCTGNVGRPAGVFHWYTFVGSESGTGLNRTAQAVQLAETPAAGEDSCTFERTSRLTLNLSRTEANRKLVVRCRVSQQQGNSDVSACTDPNTDFCRMSSQINIQYPVSVTVMSDTMTRVEGTDVPIVCNTEGNPPPYLVEWRKPGENDTTTGNTLTLTQVTVNQTGTYVCTAYNTLAGVTHNASVTVLLTVERTTTPPPTTTPVPTTPESTTKEEDGGEGDTASADSTTIIIVVVVVAVVVMVVIVVIIFFLRRRKKGKEVEEPPEKPFNNNAGINTVATRPDLVSNAYNHASPPLKSEDGLAYAELQFDNKPRSRRPLAIDDSHTDYSDVSMPQV